MKKTSKHFSSQGVQHIYQRAHDWGVIFYDDIDRLEFFCIDSVIARRYGITVYGISLMFTHLHKSIIARMKHQMCKYEQDSSSIFARAYNAHRGRKGVLFQQKFGRASRVGPKKIRENLAYVYNNHVEKGLCTHPIEERWCFLPYAKSKNPFSKPINLDAASKQLKSAIRIVDRRRKNDEFLRYGELCKMIYRLSQEEQEQLKDYIISSYMYIDFEGAASYFGSFEDMVHAFKSTSGSGWGIKEEYNNCSDKEYIKLNKLFASKGWSINKIFSMTKEELKQLANELFLQYGFNPIALQKYLHI